MSFLEHMNIHLSDPNYVPVIKGSQVYYGGSQMWFSGNDKSSKDYIIRNYGCGTIATADMLLYLAKQRNDFRTPLTEIALGEDKIIYYPTYDAYVRAVNDQYTKTRRLIAVLGPRIAYAFNSYTKKYHIGYRATWKLTLTYYDMYELIKEMLSEDIPVILSIGPNTPNLWGKKGIFFYQKYRIDGMEQDLIEDTSQEENPDKNENNLKYYYVPLIQNVNSHYVVVTGMEMDPNIGKVMLRISSWGKSYYINYEEYRDYVDNIDGTFTSSLLHVKKQD